MDKHRSFNINRSQMKIKAGGNPCIHSLAAGGKEVAVTLPYSSLTLPGHLAALAAVKTSLLTPLPISRQQSSIFFYVIV